MAAGVAAGFFICRGLPPSKSLVNAAWSRDLVQVDRNLEWYDQGDLARGDYWASLLVAVTQEDDDPGILKRLLREEPGIEVVDWALVAAGLEEGRRRLAAGFFPPESKEKREAESYIRVMEDISSILHDYRSGLAGRSTVWQSAPGYGAERMKTQVEHLYGAFYRAIWKQGDQEHLVCLRYPGAELFGTPYDVSVFDRAMRLVRWGEITAQQDGIPYGLVEVRGAAKQAIPDGRSAWRLAVITYYPDSGIDPSKRFLRDDTGDTETDEGNNIDTVVVGWEDEPVDADSRYLFGLLPTSRVRWAEPCVSPLLRRHGASE